MRLLGASLDQQRVALGALRGGAINPYVARPDIIAGLTAAAVVLPKAMTYATVAGQVPPDAGGHCRLVPLGRPDLFGRQHDGQRLSRHRVQPCRTSSDGGMVHERSRSAQPLASPVFASFSDMPPLLCLVGSEEVLLDDSLRLARAMAAAGGDATVTVAAGMQHVYPIWAGAFPEAGRAIRGIGEWVSGRLDTR